MINVVEESNEVFEKRIDIMLDIETLSTNIDTVPIQVCMVPFNILTGDVYSDKILNNFLATKSINDDVDIDMDTLYFWIEKNAEMFNEITTNCKKIGVGTKKLLTIISSYLKDINDEYDEVYIWSKTKEFDIGILNHNYQTHQMHNPIYYRNTMELRTVENILSINLGIRVEEVQDKFRPKKKSRNHNAMVDCIEQVKYLCIMLEEL